MSKEPFESACRQFNSFCCDAKRLHGPTIVPIDPNQWLFYLFVFLFMLQSAQISWSLQLQTRIELWIKYSCFFSVVVVLLFWMISIWIWISMLLTKTLKCKVTAITFNALNEVHHYSHCKRDVYEVFVICLMK